MYYLQIESMKELHAILDRNKIEITLQIHKKKIMSNP